MAKAERVGFTIKDFPPALKETLMREADEAGITLNDLAVARLAEAFKVPFEPVGRAQRGVGASRDVYLMMPLRLHQKIKHRATDKRIWPRQVMIEALQKVAA